MFIRNRITWAPDDGSGGGGGGAPAAADPAPVSTPPAAPPATGAPDAEPAAPQAALKDTLLSADPPKTEGEPPADPAKKDGAGEGEKEPPAPEPIKPEDYKLELPEGITADDPLLTAFLEGAAKGGMDNESVQAVVATLGPKLAEQLAAPMKAWTSLNEQWQAEVKADPVIGGANLPATIQTVADAINLVSTPDEARLAREALTMTGAGNNPAIVRLMHRMASRLTEQRPVQGKSPAEVKSPAAVLYPTHAAKGG